MIRLGLALMQESGADVVAEALPGRMRAQEEVRQWFRSSAEH
jgi:hypothetical protein